MISLALVALLAVTQPAPPKCPIGLVCFTPDEVGEIDQRVIELERDLTIAKVRGRRFGLTAGCGPAAAIEMVDGEVTFDPKLVCGVVWGLRW